MLTLHLPDRFPSTSRLRCTAVALAASFVAVLSHGHPEIEAALSRLNTQIAATPADAELYLARGEVYAKHHEWVSAEANYLRAAELAPALPRLDCAQGALALTQGAPREACRHLDRALSLDHRDAEALILRSRARLALDDRAGALADLDAALGLISNPRAELFLERAALLSSAIAAIRSLDQASARIGPAHILQMRALELEESNGLIDAAGERLERIAARSERKETWLKRRGDLLTRAGRHHEAARAYRAALAAIASLPDWLRESPDTAKLFSELTQLLPAST